MAAVAEQRGDRFAVEVVDAHDTDDRVDRFVRVLAQENVAVGTQLAAVDADVALALAVRQPRRLQTAIGLDRGLHDTRHELFVVAVDQAGLEGEFRCADLAAADRYACATG